MSQFHKYQHANWLLLMVSDIIFSLEWISLRWPMIMCRGGNVHFVHSFKNGKFPSVKNWKVRKFPKTFEMWKMLRRMSKLRIFVNYYMFRIFWILDILLNFFSHLSRFKRSGNFRTFENFQFSKESANYAVSDYVFLISTKTNRMSKARAFERDSFNLVSTSFSHILS